MQPLLLLLNKSSSSKHKKKGLVLLYERFLELPAPIVLALLWLAGAALIGLCVLLYVLWSFLWLSWLG
jgi:hypothetical protein